jgi:hypothetical protein
MTLPDLGQRASARRMRGEIQQPPTDPQARPHTTAVCKPVASVNRHMPIAADYDIKRKSDIGPSGRLRCSCSRTIIMGDRKLLKHLISMRTYRRIPRAMSDQGRQHSVTNADLRRSARSPSPSTVRLAGHTGRHGQRRRSLRSIRPDSATLKGTAPCDHPRSRRRIDGQVNSDASPQTESPGSSLRRRTQLAASGRRGVLRVGARARPTRTAAPAVPAVLAG